MKFVIRNLINENLILALPEAIVDAWCGICTDILIKQINAYCSENSNSDDEVTAECVALLNEKFAYINSKEKYLGSRSARDIADTLSNLSYGDIYFGVSEEQLTNYKICIETILADEGLGKARVVSVNDFKMFVTLCETMLRLQAIELTREQKDAISKIKKIVKDNKSLFKSAPYGRTANTVFTRFYNRREVYETILYGINFLLEKMSEGKSPESWRYL